VKGCFSNAKGGPDFGGRFLPARNRAGAVYTFLMPGLSKWIHPPRLPAAKALPFPSFPLGTQIASPEAEARGSFIASRLQRDGKPIPLPPHDEHFF